MCGQMREIHSERCWKKILLLTGAFFGEKLCSEAFSGNLTTSSIE